MAVMPQLNSGDLVTADHWNAHVAQINANTAIAETVGTGVFTSADTVSSWATTVQNEVFGGPGRTQRPRCSVCVTTSGYQTIVNSTNTMLNWETEVADTDSMFTPGQSGVTVPVTGRYLSVVTVNFGTLSGTVNGAIGIKLLKNTTNPDPGQAPSSSILDTNTAPWNYAAEGPIVSMVSYVPLNAGDVVRVSVWHNFNNGTARNIPVWPGFGNKGTSWDLVYQGK